MIPVRSDSLYAAFQSVDEAITGPRIIQNCQSGVAGNPASDKARALSAIHFGRQNADQLRADFAGYFHAFLSLELGDGNHRIGIQFAVGITHLVTQRLQVQLRGLGEVIRGQLRG